MPYKKDFLPAAWFGNRFSKLVSLHISPLLTLFPVVNSSKQLHSIKLCPKRLFRSTWAGWFVFVRSQGGHPFQQRCAHSAYSHARLQQESPVFLLLLDCVWQLWRQFPLALGFSESLLLRLATEAYASDYGTFLCNNHQERSVGAILAYVKTRRFNVFKLILTSGSLFSLRCALGVMEKTHCLFQALLRPQDRDYYSNPLYEYTELAIWPSVHPQSLQLWKGKLHVARCVMHTLILLSSTLILRCCSLGAFWDIVGRSWSWLLTHVWPPGFFLRWTQQARHLEEAQQEIRNMVIELGKLALSRWWGKNVTDVQFALTLELLF